MSDHEFEKQVRQKLNSLQLSPSADTWQKIEDRLRRRRPRAVIWLPLLAVALLIGGYFFFTDPVLPRPVSGAVTHHPADVAGDHAGVRTPRAAGGVTTVEGEREQKVLAVQTVGADEKAVPKGRVPRSAKPCQPVSARPVAVGQRVVHPSSGADGGMVEPGGSVAGRLVKPGKQPVDRLRQPRRLGTGAASVDGTMDVFAKRTLRPDKIEQVAYHQQPGADRALADKQLRGNAGLSSGMRPEEDPSPVFLSFRQTQKPPFTDPAASWKVGPKKWPSPAVVTNAPIRIRDHAARKWNVALTAAAGLSAVNEGGVFGFSKPKVEDVAARTAFYAPSVSYAPTYKPSTISPGLSFSVGAEVKRSLSRRFSLSLGLAYSQLNTRSHVGERIDQANIVDNGTRGYLFVQSYYLLDQNETKEYGNRYHFVEIPLSLHTRLTGAGRLPVYWNASFSVSRLLTSTSLHFDGTTGVYYKNDRLLNQTQAAVGTGLSVALFSNRSHPLWIGPSARSNMSTILKKDISSTKHFVNVGLDLKWYLRN